MLPETLTEESFYYFILIHTLSWGTYYLLCEKNVILGPSSDNFLINNNNTKSREVVVVIADAYGELSR